MHDNANRQVGSAEKSHMERLTRVRQAHHEHPHLDQHPGDGGVKLAEVDLGLSAGGVGLGHRHLDPVQTQLALAVGDIPRHRHLSHLRAVLGDQPLPHPTRGMALLARHLLITQQPGIDHLDIRIDRRPRPARVCLPRRRDRRDQRLAHRAPMHPMPLSQLADRQLLNPPVTPDLFEQFHLRPCHSPNLHADDD